MHGWRSNEAEEDFHYSQSIIPTHAIKNSSTEKIFLMASRQQLLKKLGVWELDTLLKWRCREEIRDYELFKLTIYPWRYFIAVRSSNPWVLLC
jgi:hypothetical protein